MKYYNDTNSCEICGKSFELSWPIMKEHSRGVQWYEQYRVKDENVSKSINALWKNIIMNGD